MSRPDFGVGLFCEIKNVENVLYTYHQQNLQSKKYLTKDYITCLDYAYMSSNTIICDVVSKNWLFSQKNESINFETLNSISKYHVDKRRKDLGSLNKIK